MSDRPLHPTRRHRSRPAFTLVELLMVIAALAIIAGIVVPQVETAVIDARHSAMLTDLHELTTAIERFRLEHNGAAPDIDSNSLPQLVQPTNAAGETGQGAAYIFGPYLRNPIPPNPLNGSSQVFFSATSPPTNLDQRVGWVYHPDTAQLWGGLSTQWSGP
jgi:prepilin-type N-terminal cleavage/methylation domain-containing protein